MATKRIKYQTIEATIPNGTATSSVVNVKAPLDSMYQRCTAVAVLKIGGSNNVGLGIRSQSDQVIDLVHSKLLEVQQDTPVQGRFIPVNIPAAGKEVTISLQPILAATTADNSYQIVFKLED